MSKKKLPRPRRPPKKLTERQKAFVREYPLDFNGQRAAIAAGYAPKNARVTASKYLTQPNIQTALAKQAAPRLKKQELKASDVLERCTRIAFADVRGFVDGRGRLLHISDVPDEIEPLIKRFKANEQSVVTEIQVENRLAALKLLMQNFGLLKEQIRLELASDLPLEDMETIDAFTDEELERWNGLNAQIQAMLHPDVVEGQLLPPAPLGIPASSTV